MMANRMAGEAQKFICEQTEAGSPQREDIEWMTERIAELEGNYQTMLDENVANIKALQEAEGHKNIATNSCKCAHTREIRALAKVAALEALARNPASHCYECDSVAHDCGCTPNVHERAVDALPVEKLSDGTRERAKRHMVAYQELQPGSKPQPKDNDRIGGGTSETSSAGGQEKQ